MPHEDTQHQANELLRLALKYMGKYEIPVTPSNYSVWYEFVSGNDAALAEAVNEMLNGSKPITAENTQELYLRYISDGYTVNTEELLEQVKRILVGLSENINLEKKEMDNSETALQGLSGQLTEIEISEEISTLIADIVAESQKIVESGGRFQEKLEASNNEVNDLRKELVLEKKRSQTDPLTEIPNRLAFQETIAYEMETAQTNGTPLCIIMCDIDHFKKVNDSYGHLVGDMVLKLSAEMIKGFIKGRDFVARFGGEEFIIILPDTPIDGAMTVAEKIRIDFESKSWKRRESKKQIGAITLSFGVAKYRYSERVEDLFARVDKALYHSKQTGRNRVTSELDEGVA